MLLSMRPCWVQVLACTADCQPADGPGDHNRSEPYGRRQDHYVSDIGPSSIASRQLYQLSTIKRGFERVRCHRQRHLCKEERAEQQYGLPWCCKFVLCGIMQTRECFANEDPLVGRSVG